MHFQCMSRLLIVSQRVLGRNSRPAQGVSAQSGCLPGTHCPGGETAQGGSAQGGVCPLGVTVGVWQSPPPGLKGRHVPPPVDRHRHL